jgi:hypothetical protein
MQKSLAPAPSSEGKIAVSLWLAHDPRVRIAGNGRLGVVA